MLSMNRSDVEIVKAVTDAFNQSLLIPDEGITVTAADGTVWLEGTVKWEFERMAAIDRALDVPGVGAVYNRLAVAHAPRPVATIFEVPDQSPGQMAHQEIAHA